MSSLRQPQNEQHQKQCVIENQARFLLSFSQQAIPLFTQSADRCRAPECQQRPGPQAYDNADRQRRQNPYRNGLGRQLHHDEVEGNFLGVLEREQSAGGDSAHRKQ